MPLALPPGLFEILVNLFLAMIVIVHLAFWSASSGGPKVIGTSFPSISSSPPPGAQGSVAPVPVGLLWSDSFSLCPLYSAINLRICSCISFLASDPVLLAKSLNAL